MGRRKMGIGRSPWTVTPREKPISLIAICPGRGTWSPRVEGTGVTPYLEEKWCRRIRAVGGDPLFARLLHRRSDDVQLLASEAAVAAVVRVQSADADAGAATAQRAVDQADRLPTRSWLSRPVRPG